MERRTTSVVASRLDIVRACFVTSLASWLLAVGCHRAPPAPPRPPEGEVWLTREQERAMELRVEPVEFRTISDTLTANGRVTFPDSQVAHVYSPVSGRVTEIFVELGQHVLRGEPLAALVSPDIGIASSDLDKARADAETAEHELRRTRFMVAEGAGSIREVELAQDAYARARAELARARQRTALLRGATGDGVTQSFVVRSILEGEVVARFVTPGIEVQGQYSGGTPFELFTIGNLDRVWVLGEVYEMDISRVHVGALVRIRVVAYPGRVFEGTVDWLSGMLDPDTHAAHVRCVIPNEGHELRPEMYATMEIVAEPMRELAIPSSARLRLGDGTFVFLKLGKTKDGRERFRRIPVVVDEGASQRWLPVRHGLSGGEQIVVDNAIDLAGLL